MVDNRPVEAEKILDKLVEQHEGLTLLHAALGQAQVKAGQTNDGVASLRHAVELFPRNVPVTIRYAEALMKAGRAAEAHTVLLDLFNNVPPTPEQIRLTALAASAAGDPGMRISTWANTRSPAATCRWPPSSCSWRCPLPT